MAQAAAASAGWRSSLPQGVRPYTEAAPLAALFLGISSGFPYAMIGATLTTRLAQDGIDKSTITAFALAFLVYNLKFLWAWVVDGVRLPLLGRLGQRVCWMLVTGVLVMAAVANLAFVDPARQHRRRRHGGTPGRRRRGHLRHRHRRLPHRVCSSRASSASARACRQYGWRIGSAGAGALALVLAARVGWEVAYLACAALALPAMLTALDHRRAQAPPRTRKQARASPKRWRRSWRPFVEFFQRKGAFLVLLFILLHKIGDTLGQPRPSGCCSTTSASPTTRSPSGTSASASGPI